MRKRRGLKRQILDAYLRDPEKEYTTQQIILRINYIRHLENKKSIERSDLSRPHSELAGDGVLCDIRQEGVTHYYKINTERVKKLKLL